MRNSLEELEFCKKKGSDEGRQIKEQLKAEKLSKDALLNLTAEAFARANMQNRYILFLAKENANLKIALGSKDNPERAETLRSEVLAMYQELVTQLAIDINTLRVKPLRKNQKKATDATIKYTPEDHILWDKIDKEIDPERKRKKKDVAELIRKRLNLPAEATQSIRKSIRKIK
ncbi:hypothetical protein [Legionella sp. 227]|uniref:hypothetical protein n=1 Tax=Legionella sp. 227 TaxID=3367288 RepID=UPI00370DD452